MKPYIGATVHYHSTYSDGPNAAIITAVHDDSWVSLFIISAGGGTRFASHVEHKVGWDWITPPAPSTGSQWDGI